MDFYIGDIKICKNNTPLIIPEIGINHNGSLKIAFEMVDAAFRAGAKLVKHQTHIVDDEMSSLAQKVIPGNSNISIYEIMKSCALSEEQEFELKSYIESKGMVFLSTPFSRAAVDRLERFDVEAYKIGSGEMNNYPLVEYIASIGKPMIISTGMNNLDSIKRTVDIVTKKNVNFALLHTTNLYPTPARLVRLGAMQELMREYPDTVIGLSDHTINNNSCIAAMVLGAGILERHFTDTYDRQGPDLICSMDESSLKELLAAAQEVPQMIGGKKIAAEEEQVTIDFAFATVVTIKPIKKGEYFTKENLWVKRPGTGEILAKSYDEIIGQKASIDIEEGIHLKWNMAVKER